MPVSLAVAAVVAGNAGLDEARPVRRRQVVGVVARMCGERDERRRVGCGRVRRARVDARDGLPYERAQSVFVHALTSTASTMPMIAASTAAALRPSASPAALPSMTTSTFSPI